MEQLNCLRCQYRHDDNGNCTAVGGFCTAVSAAHCRLLQEYLGTGLTPEGVEALTLSMMGKDVAEIKEFDGLPIDRLKELAEADKEGRVVVLPCKPGDGLWTFCSHPAEQVYSFTVTDISTLNGRTVLNTSRCGVIDARDVGKTVFRTREEAEKALEAMKDVN